MIELTYLAVLLISIGGLTLVDFRFKLAWWSNPALTAKVLAAMLVLFLVWDVAGIVLGIFSMGSSPYISGLILGPDMPIEEPIFLYLLSYQAIIFWRFMRRKNV